MMRRTAVTVHGVMHIPVQIHVNTPPYKLIMTRHPIASLRIRLPSVLPTAKNKRGTQRVVSLQY